MSTQHHTRKRLSPWTILGVVAGFILFVALSPVIVFLIWNAGQTRSVNKLVEQIKAAGEPVTVADLSAAFPLEPGDEDVTRLWIAGLDPLDTDQFKAAGEKLPFVGAKAPEVNPKLGVTWNDIADAEKFLTLYQFSRDQFHEAARRGGHGRFPVDHSLGFDTLLPYTQKARSAARLLRLEFEVNAHRGGAALAAKSLKTMLCIPHSLVNEPTLVSQLVPIAIDGVTTSALAEKLCLIPFSDDDLRDLQKRLREKTPAKNMRIGLLGERAMGHSVMLNPKLIGEGGPRMKPFQADSAMHLEFMKRYIEAVDLGFPKCLAEADKIEADLMKEVSEGMYFLHLYTSLIVPATGAALEATARSISTIQAADAGIAVELYRREKGELPKTLDALVPKYLPAVPTDPYSGNPMIYKADENGFTIYSVGRNKIDDNGRVELKPGEDHRIRDEGLFFPLQ